MTDRDYVTCPNCQIEYAVTIRERPLQKYIEGKQYCPMCGELVRGP